MRSWCGRETRAPKHRDHETGGPDQVHSSPASYRNPSLRAEHRHTEGRANRTLHSGQSFAPTDLRGDPGGVSSPETREPVDCERVSVGFAGGFWQRYLSNHRWSFFFSTEIPGKPRRHHG